jgi:uncharacterized repeat protein (TIGR03943 family)
VNREVQAVVLVLLGATITRVAAGEEYLRYVKPVMQVPLLVTGALLVLLGAWAAWRSSRPAETHDAHDVGAPETGGDGVAGAGQADTDDGHGHGGEPRVGWLLLVPVLAIFLVAPPALGADAAARDSGVVTADAGAALPDLPAGDPVEITLLDLAWRTSVDDGASVVGRQLRLVGFAAPRPDGGWDLARFTMQCCAADALSVKFPVAGAPAPAADQWVEVIATVQMPAVDEATADDVAAAAFTPPTLQVQAITPIDPPRQPYL